MASTSTRNSSSATNGRAAPQDWPCDAWRSPLLVVRLSSLGDVVLATGAIDLIHTRRPDLAIDILTRAAYAPVWHGHPAVRRLLLADGTQDTAGNDAGESYGHVLDLQGGPKGRRAARAWAPGTARTTYPRAALERRLLVLWGLRAAPVELLVVRFARPIAGRALPADRLMPRTQADPSRVGILRSELHARARAAGGFGSLRGWVLLSPGASRRLKAIPPALCDAIAAGLRARGWGTVLLEAPSTPRDAHCAGTGAGTGEGPAVPATGWVGGSAAGSVPIFRGPLPEVMALLAAVDAVIASDSGILHLAAALGRPALALFGPTVPELGFAPLGHSRVLGADLACRPCHIHGPTFCWLGHERCWGDLAADGAVAALEDLLPDAPQAR
jgi:heptosyltransferase II